MPLTTEEKQELISEIGKGTAANFAEALNPIKDAITGLQANQDKLTETLTANSRAEEKTKRDAVAAVHGDIVANALSGDAWTQCSSRWAKLLRWVLTMHSSTKKPAHLPQTNTSSKEPE